ncbi:GGDEF domain-containing protein [Zobellella taiwanensis]|uniref:Diguanylate cyclase DosC n=1 Tax=Zobellella taiwanensis TaxID=347535 RepID=A0A2P7R391_9GAMM|nr:diguanylate cyclase [Zobellella taiwanensis]PSJ44677.1 GGDEF domain-containing protein [Zobellella taiwanensis]
MTDPLGYGQRQWLQILNDYDPALRRRVRELVLAHSERMADEFYQYMITQPEAREFLDHDQVNLRLKASMQHWLEQSFAIDDEAAIALTIERQLEVGRVHARINLPINLVSMGARLHKKRLMALVFGLEEEPGYWQAACGYLQEVMDLSLELMSLAYVSKSERKSRAAEAYRLHTLGLNMPVERERQRAALLDWSQELIFGLHRGDRPPGGIIRSEFGLWFQHKAASVFEGAPELGQIEQALQQIDLVILPELRAAGSDTERLARQMAALQQEVKAVGYFLATLFDRYIELEHGRDTLTRLLDRRFLPAVLNREVRLAKRGGAAFSVILFDVDHFKQINDSHGHEGGDLVLQQIANLVAGAVRSSDFTFRYGGEELLVVLVEAEPAKALEIAEKIREKVAANRLQLPEGKTMQATLSGGVAGFDGHPDYEYLIGRADKALYRAKHQGRNRCLLAD